MAGRVIYYYERTMTSTVNNIEHIESQSLNGVGVVKIYLPAGRRHPHRHRPGHLHLADRAEADAAGHHAAADPEL